MTGDPLFLVLIVIVGLGFVLTLGSYSSIARVHVEIEACVAPTVTIKRVGPDVCQALSRKPLAFNHDRRDGHCDRGCVSCNAAKHATAPDRHGYWARGRRLLRDR